MRKVLTVLAVAAAAAMVAVPVIGAASIAGRCPTVEALRSYRPSEASRVFAADGSVVADLSPQRRIVVELTDMPALLRDGFVAVEDRRFWSHPGVDPRSVLRALVHDVATLSLSEGFSTITMQLVRNVFPEQLPASKRLGRKACEVWLALRAERRLSKRDILALYLNQIYLGSGLYGVEAAAQGYFGTSVDRLDAAEAALLVGLVKSPEGYNPRRNPEAARARRNVVLDVMQREGVLPLAEAARARARPVRLAPSPEAAGSAPYFVAAVRRELRQLVGADADVRGLRVYTALEPELQRAARDALVRQIERIEGGAYGRYSHPRPAADAQPMDDAPFLQGMVVAMDPGTGAIRALVGGRDFRVSQFDRALQAKRQPGSAFKPLVYAAAIERGLPLTARIETGPVVVDAAGAPPWRPGDHVADTLAALSVRRALALSSNHAAVRVGRWVGEERVAGLARDLGISTPVPDYPSILLGSAEVVPAELVAAFAAFGNGGYRVRPRLITRVEDTEGRVLWEPPFEIFQALDSGIAFLTLTLLEDVVNSGTGTSVRSNGFWQPAAGKTGTTNDARDVWFIGMTPELVAGVWLGFDQPRTIMPGASGGRLAAPAWADMMSAWYADRPTPAPWTPPHNVVGAHVDLASGYLATDGCPIEDVRIEYFLRGTEPYHYCPLHPDTGLDGWLERMWRRARKIF